METKIIAFSAGNGPVECSWALAKIIAIFIKEMEQNKIDHQVLNQEKGDLNGTLKSILIQVKGEKLSSFLKAWIGTMQWIGTSVIRPSHKRKNWFVQSFELNEKEVFQFNEKDFSYTSFRSSGPGGQHVNKVSSAVRATHSLTGISVAVSESRSQHQNKKIARLRLIERLEGHRIAELSGLQNEVWLQKLQVNRGNPIRVFNGGDFKKSTRKKMKKHNRQHLKMDLKNKLWDQY